MPFYAPFLEFHVLLFNFLTFFRNPSRLPRADLISELLIDYSNSIGKLAGKSTSQKSFRVLRDVADTMVTCESLSNFLTEVHSRILTGMNYYNAF